MKDLDTDIRIRQATTADGRMIAGLINSLVAELNGVAATPPSAELIDCTMRMLNLRGAVWGFVAEHDGAPIGAVMVNECAGVRAGGLYGEITELFVMPDHRSCGVATRLIAAVRALGREREWSRLEVGPTPTKAWEKTHRLFAHAGFEESGPRMKLTL
ncbi:MAG: GNAT family N-acetyltransferase [Rhodobacteraceae bacterium]|nr:MAG: GNAT family N-acetyltransferase [Paracoccaceae bacterium]